MAVIKNLEDEPLLEQAFGHKLMNSVVHDFEGHIVVKTIASEPYIDAVWLDEEQSRYVKNLPESEGAVDKELGPWVED